MNFKVGDRVVRLDSNMIIEALYGGVPIVLTVKKVTMNGRRIRLDYKGNWFDAAYYKAATPVQIAQWRCREEGSMGL